VLDERVSFLRNAPPFDFEPASAIWGGLGGDRDLHQMIENTPVQAID
jgi:hypothetical protein